MSFGTGKESELLRGVLELLRLRGIPAWRNNSGAARIGGRLIRFGEPGSPDVIAVLPPHGQFLGLELKSARGRLSPAQVAFHGQILAAGAAVAVVRDVGQLVRLLDELLGEGP